MQSTGSLEERLERGEVVHFPAAPFALPAGDDLTFLCTQSLRSRRDKNISYNPANGKVNGFRWQGQDQADRLHRILAAFAEHGERWLAGAAPAYAAGWERDRVSFRPVEEATRKLRLSARNDLLHVDNFPSRPTRGHRILRLFANVNPTEPRIWLTSDPFPRLLERYGAKVGLPAAGGSGWVQRVARALMSIARKPRPAYDDFMLRLHHYLKRNDQFQEKGARRFWEFGPGSVWLVFTDCTSHAVLRGRFALELTYFVPVHCMRDPRQAPIALLERACGVALAA